jgi:hypothetical protein
MCLRRSHFDPVIGHDGEVQEAQYLNVGPTLHFHEPVRFAAIPLSIEPSLRLSISLLLAPQNAQCGRQHDRHDVSPLGITKSLLDTQHDALKMVDVRFAASSSALKEHE